MKIFSYAVLYTLLSLSFFHSASAQEEEWKWTTPTEGAPNVMEEEVLVPEATIIINEVLPYPDTLSVESSEYVELYNYGLESFSLQGLKLSDKSSVVHTFSSNDVIAGGEYFVIRGDFSLNQTTDESIRLIGNDGVDIDVFSYTKKQVHKGVSLNRMCDVYELRFCEVVEGSRTPGTKNKKASLMASTDTPSGELAFGSKVTLSASNPLATILYTFTPDAPLPESTRYTGPITIVRDTTLYFFAVYEGQSSSIQKVDYSITREQETTIWLNEVFVSESGTSWVELHNSGKTAVHISSYLLSIVDVHGKETVLSFPKEATVYATRFYVLNLSEDVSLEGATISLISPKKEEIGKLVIPKTLKGASMVLSQFTQRYNVLHDIEKLYVETDIPTKNTHNIVARTSSADKDGDYLTEKQEKSIDTNPEKFDTNDNHLPDFYDKGKDMVGKTHQFLYRALLTKMVFVEAAWKNEGVLFVSGKTLPMTTVTIKGLKKPLVLKSDNLGYFSSEIDGADEDIVLALLLTDQAGVSSFEVGPIRVEQSAEKGDIVQAGQVIISEALPNPEGADTRDTEWLALTNTTVNTLQFTPTFQIGTTKKKLTSVTIGAKETIRIYASDLGITLPNTGTIILLQGTRELSKVSYQDAKDGEVLTFFKGSSVKVTNSLKSNVGTATVALKHKTATLSSIPSLQNLHTSTLATVNKRINAFPPIEKKLDTAPVPEKSYAIGLFFMMLCSTAGSFIWKW